MEMILFFWSAVGCSDYNLQPKALPEEEAPPAEEEPPPVLEPLMVVDPMRIEVVGFCETVPETRTLNILNAGEGELEISEISMAASGWVLSPVALPLVIPPSGLQTLTMDSKRCWRAHICMLPSLFGSLSG